MFTGVGRDFGMSLSDLTLPLSHRAAILAYGPQNTLKLHHFRNRVFKRLVVGKTILFIMLFLYYVYMALKGFWNASCISYYVFWFTGPKPLGRWAPNHFELNPSDTTN